MTDNDNGSASRTAGEAGWHASRYNLMAKAPDTKMTAIANLYKGTCAEYTPIELYLLSVLEELDEAHPIIERFAKRGIIANFDERAALEAMGRAVCAYPHEISLTICPTMGCNFDCPCCFEDHFAGKMSPEVQDDVIALASRMLDASGAKNIGVTWFGGEPLKAYVEELAAESGNDISYYPAPVSGSDAADARGEQVGLLCGSDASEIGIRQESERFRVGRGHYCGAHSLWNVGIDEKGNLQKCWEAVDKPAISFATAHDWDPKDPFGTASAPDNLTMYLSTASPIPDEECRECIWLPTCVGGCPHKRLFGERRCLAFKDNPEAYVMALHARIGADSDR